MTSPQSSKSQKIVTVKLGNHHSAQGVLVEEMENGRAVVDAGGRLVAGALIKSSVETRI